MQNLVSFCAFLALLLLASCGSPSEKGAVLSLYQSDKIVLSESDVLNSQMEAVDRKLSIDVRLNLIWNKEWDKSPQAHYKVERTHQFTIPAFVKNNTKGQFEGIAVIDLIRPKSETTLPKELRCVYRQSAPDRNFTFLFCTEKSALITMAKLDKIQASALNLISAEQREKVSFQLSLGDSVSGYFAYPLNEVDHGKTKTKFNGEVELNFQK
ncbi:MAG: hypothetical protein L6Q33_04015 [Bacteriovoracaceae bacterium]|jgi:hypothetical protein|nr:hypothetical protein [Bacteriovoracaceae bacterium]